MPVSGNLALTIILHVSPSSSAAGAAAAVVRFPVCATFNNFPYRMPADAEMFRCNWSDKGVRGMRANNQTGDQHLRCCTASVHALTAVGWGWEIRSSYHTMYHIWGSTVQYDDTTSESLVLGRW